MELEQKNIILRIVKPYPEARNHVYTGRVVAYDEGFVAIDGSVLHFGRATTEDPTGGFTKSDRAIRWVPKERIQYIRQLPEGIDPFDPEQFEITAAGGISTRAADRPDLLPE